MHHNVYTDRHRSADQIGHCRRRNSRASRTLRTNATVAATPPSLRPKNELLHTPIRWWNIPEHYRIGVWSCWRSKPFPHQESCINRQFPWRRSAIARIGCGVLRYRAVEYGKDDRRDTRHDELRHDDEDVVYPLIAR